MCSVYASGTMRCDGERMFLHTFRMFSYGIFSTDVFFCVSSTTTASGVVSVGARDRDACMRWVMVTMCTRWHKAIYIHLWVYERAHTHMHAIPLVIRVRATILRICQQQQQPEDDMHRYSAQVCVCVSTAHRGTGKVCKFMWTWFERKNRWFDGKQSLHALTNELTAETGNVLTSELSQYELTAVDRMERYGTVSFWTTVISGRSLIYSNSPII